MKGFLILALLLPIGAHAGNFAARVKMGRKVLTTAVGQKYEASWGKVLGQIMRTCIPPGSASPANLGEFTFVANVNDAGVVSSVAVKPRTRVSLCFAQHFGNAHLPPPPGSPRMHGLYPVSDEMEVVQ